MLDLGRTFLQSVDRAAAATALVDGALRLSWSEWARVIGGVQHGLADLGLRPGDHPRQRHQSRLLLTRRAEHRVDRRDLVQRARKTSLACEQRLHARSKIVAAR